MLNAKLIVVGGDSTEQEFQLHLPAIVGRGVEADIPVKDGLISRRHAELFESKGVLFVRDLGSRNGTFVNNRRIADAAPIEPDQLLTLGTVTFRAVYQVPETVAMISPVGLKETVRINFDQTESLIDSPQFVSRLSDTDTVDIEEYEMACLKASFGKASCSKPSDSNAANVMSSSIDSDSPGQSLPSALPR